ncbi:hypothetical protein EXIGLDRAFT_738009 [Exidia glandulosa HHB12029]|uniref:Microbial-type PARG catalytic domain-containing protein n=1 Tax=Exidia glandulosa HHB12029 TaxID=1314781 RepID=A0A165Q6H4_EXIGL|nr:hypothetical protein EXIGLDRAFT_738009 [Exidia glandulosa HHB12029]
MRKFSGQRERLAKIAGETLSAIENGSYMLGTSAYRLAPAVAAMTQNTIFEAASTPLANWQHRTSHVTAHTTRTSFAISEVSTLVAVRKLAQDPAATVGALNFASAKHPGGGFLTGAQAQEESLARSSTLYCSLTCPVGAQFYAEHKEPGYYSHAMLWSPGVLFFRSDDGGWLPPVAAGVLTSAAVNAGAVKQRLAENEHAEADGRIEACMHERMARILALFERQGSTHVVLGSFGTGVFKNDVSTIAKLWADLLGPNQRFENSFRHVEFAILGRETFEVFKAGFERRCGQLWARIPA